MKPIKSIILPTAAVAFLGMFATSCSDDINMPDGQGMLKMKMIVNSEVTRAEVDDAELAEKCVIYVSNSKGLIHKFQGLDNVPSDLWLKSGHYVAEAWTGDSVTASFDKKFYRAYEPFDITTGVTNVVLNCKIANVVASVNRERISEEMLPNFTVTVANSRGELVFNSETMNERGFFMMPNGDTKLTYTVEGVNMLGTKFTKTGEIPDVERAHEYRLNLSYNESADPYDVGGAFITISIDDTELVIEDNIEIHSLPVLIGLDTDIINAVTSPKQQFSDINLSSAAYSGYDAIGVKFSNPSAFGVESAEYDLCQIAEASETALRNAGFTWSRNAGPDNSEQMRVKIAAQMLNRLDNGEYSITFDLRDGLGRSREYVLKISVSDASVAVRELLGSDIRSYSALVRADVLKTDVTNPGIRFREKGAADWQTVNSTRTRASELAFRLTNLKAATTYEVQAIADGYVNPATREFTTEAAYVIPNASFEDWSTYSFGGKNVPFPGLGSAPSFWSTGNAGSMTMNKAITTQSADMKHSGSSSIKLESQFVGVMGIGKFAAGNVFAGDYVRTDGTDGVLNWGREMPKCHPVKLSGWLNYRPKAVTDVESGFTQISKGDLDKGTVYVAVVKEQREIRTKKSNRQLFDKDADYVLAYGQLILDADFGPDGQLKEFEIPITWKNADYDGQYYIIIVASASLYGDYFTGGPSVMYLDDLVLSYE